MFVFGIVGQLVWVFSDEVVMGSIPFGDSEIFFVSCLNHVDEFSVIFIYLNMFHIYILQPTSTMLTFPGLQDGCHEEIELYFKCFGMRDWIIIKFPSLPLKLVWLWIHQQVKSCGRCYSWRHGSWMYKKTTRAHRYYPLLIYETTKINILVHLYFKMQPVRELDNHVNFEYNYLKDLHYSKHLKIL